MSIEQQLAEYFELQDELHPAISPDEVTGPPVRVSTPVHPTSNPWWAAVAAAGVVVVLGAVGLLASVGSRDDATGVETPSTTFAPSVTASDITWHQVDMAGLRNQHGWSDVSIGGGGVAKFGASYVIPPSECRAENCSWLISDDTLDWRVEQVPIDAPVGETVYSGWVSEESVWFVEEGLEDDFGHKRPTGIAEREPFGSLRILQSEGAAWIETLWVPPAGAESGLSILQSRGFGTCLTNLSSDGMMFDIGYHEDSDGPGIVVIQNSGFRAVPNPGDGGPCGGGFIDGSPYVLGSTTNGSSQSNHLWRLDGETWSRLPDPEGVGTRVGIGTAGGTRPPRFGSLAVSGGRAFLGVSDGTTWTSTDFATWTLTKVTSLDTSGLDPHGIRSTTFGWLATGYDTMPVGVAYRSTDGLNWHTITTPTLEHGSVSYADGIYVFITDRSIWVGHPSSP